MAEQGFRSRSWAAIMPRCRRALPRGRSASAAFARPSILVALLVVMVPICVALTRSSPQAMANSAEFVLGVAAASPTPNIGPVGDNSAGTGMALTKAVLSVEPTGTQTGRFLLSTLVIQGAGASTATITAPSGWTAITPTWPCKGSEPPNWKADNVYTASATIMPAVGNAGGFVFEVSSSCTSGAVEPVAWSQENGGTMYDGTCVWVNIGVPYELQMAAAWRIATAADGPATLLTWNWSIGAAASVVNTLYDNVSTSSPIDVVGSATCTFGTAGASVPASPITTNVADDALVGLFGAAGASQQLELPLSNAMNPVADEDDIGIGPANLNAYVLSLIAGNGAPGKYGPFTATQTADGESVGVVLSLAPPHPAPSSTPTPTNSVVLMPPALNFGTVRVAHGSAPISVTLTNGTKKPITISGTAIGSDYNVLVTTCSSMLTPGQSCDYYISFEPLGTGTKNETFRVSDSASDSPQKVELHGIGTTH